MTAPATEEEEVVADIRAAAEELGGVPSVTEYRERDAGPAGDAGNKYADMFVELTGEGVEVR